MCCYFLAEILCSQPIFTAFNRFRIENISLISFALLLMADCYRWIGLKLINKMGIYLIACNTEKHISYWLWLRFWISRYDVCKIECLIRVNYKQITGQCLNSYSGIIRKIFLSFFLFLALVWKLKCFYLAKIWSRKTDVENAENAFIQAKFRGTETRRRWKTFPRNIFYT